MKSKNIVIGVLSIAIIVMGVAFAAFSTSLDISGTASISSTWKIDFSAYKDYSMSGTACDYYSVNSIDGEYVAGNVDMEVIGSTATITADIIAPGDLVRCYVMAKNNGTLNAKLTSFEAILPDGASDYYDVDVYYEESPSGDVLWTVDTAKDNFPDYPDTEWEALASHILVVDISYREDVTKKAEGSIKFTATANYQQAL